MKDETVTETFGSASLEKGLILFERILRDRGRTSLAALADDMKLPRSTLYRAIATLESRGLIARIAHGRYDVGMMIVVQMETVSAKAQLAAEDCNATAHLGVMENDMVTYLVKETGKNANAAFSFTQENFQLEAYCSGIGKVLLAWLPSATRAKYLAGGPLIALTKQTITDPEILKEHLKRVRIEQFASDEGEVSDDLRCLAVPLWTHSQPMTAAISLSFVQPGKSRKGDATYLVQLRACAAKLSRRLGNAGRTQPYRRTSSTKARRTSSVELNKA
jgi:IclR family acetate operon transcriptional repressor